MNKTKIGIFLSLPPDSKITICVIPTNEELAIARKSAAIAEAGDLVGADDAHVLAKGAGGKTAQQAAAQILNSGAHIRLVGNFQHL